jgi:hypothetical protein
MITSSGIIFSHSRIESILQGGKYVSSLTSLGTLPIIAISEISVDKQAVKVYYPYGNTKSIYMPTGMNGPIVRLVAHCENIGEWSDVFTNDILTVSSFGFPTWEVILQTGSSWWVDITTKESQSGKRKNSAIRYELTINLYKREMVS